MGHILVYENHRAFFHVLLDQTGLLPLQVELSPATNPGREYGGATLAVVGQLHHVDLNSDLIHQRDGDFTEGATESTNLQDLHQRKVVEECLAGIVLSLGASGFMLVAGNDG